MDHKQLPQDPEQVDRLVDQLHSDDNFVRAEAARQLCNLGEVAQRTLPQLLALTDDPWYQVRIQVPRAIIHLGATTDEAAVVLPRLLHDPDETVRLYAQEALRVVSSR
jgi:HEAT repeat protein